jgi:hypothetical protein
MFITLSHNLLVSYSISLPLSFSFSFSLFFSFSFLFFSLHLHRKPVKPPWPDGEDMAGASSRNFARGGRSVARFLCFVRGRRVVSLRSSTSRATASLAPAASSLLLSGGPCAEGNRGKRGAELRGSGRSCVFPAPPRPNRARERNLRPLLRGIYFWCPFGTTL